MAPRTADEIQDDHESVIGIRLVCQMGLAGNKYNPTFSTNHWSIFLLLQGNLTVRANMGADDSSTGILHWSTQNYKVFKSSVRSWDYPVLPGVEVSRFARTIYDLGRHEYDNSGTDSGYRWWW